MKKIYFITSNKGKVLEAQNKFSTINIDIVQKNFGYPEIQAEKLEDVAVFGVKYLQDRINEPFILEDAGLFIDVLNGFPGVYSSYVYHTLGCEGVLLLMKDFNESKRDATFRSVFAYKEPKSKPLFFVGECDGKISTELLGDNGFGYDPIFIPHDSNRTFAQMKTDEKNSFSHRGKSLDKLINNFGKNITI